jgi:hypothetical protein
VESREEDFSVWMDGNTAADTALRYNFNPAIAAQISLDASPYFEDGGIVCQWGPSSMHLHGAHHLLGDGSVHFIRDTISAKLYVALCTRAGGETIEHVD